MTDPRHELEILLVNLGTPAEATPEAVRAFLSEFLSDPLVVDWPRWLWLPVLRGIVLRKRPASVAELYRSIWTPEGSPLRAQSERLASALDELTDDDVGVRAAFRYGTPSLEEELHDAAKRAKRVVAVPLFPHRTASSSGSVVREVDRAARALGIDGRVRCLAIEPDDAGYIEALRDRATTCFARSSAPPDHLVVSFHGIPARVNRGEGDAYRRDCERTTAALLDALEWEPARATLGFQSKFGPERWLEPATADLFASLPARGVRHLGVIAPGFLTDGLETLEELAVQGREQFRAAGGEELSVVPAVADHTALCASLARLATRGAKSDVA